VPAGTSDLSTRYESSFDRRAAFPSRQPLSSTLLEPTETRKPSTNHTRTASDSSEKGSSVLCLAVRPVCTTARSVALLPPKEVRGFACPPRDGAAFIAALVHSFT